MNNIEGLEKCSNCGACMNICPVDAIYLKKNSLFYKVSIDKEKCLHCGKCMKVCPIVCKEAGRRPTAAFWGYAFDSEIVKQSSSGGIFSVIAEYILQQKGVVYGAAFDDLCKEVNVLSTDSVTLDALRRSKYVESIVGFSFRSVKEDLEKEKLVLYCGTPCQIAGLKRFLGKDYPNLYTCDFACGGLSSHSIYQDYLQLLERRYHSKVIAVNFRPKTYGWSIYSIQILFQNGKRYISPGVLDPFFCAFIKEHVNIRAYCYECDFAENHVSDLSLADFWRFKDIVGKKHNNKGISLVLVNSDKGQQLLTHNNKRLKLNELSLDQAGYNLHRPAINQTLMELRDEYLEAYKRFGLLLAADVIRRPKGMEAKKFFIKCKIKGIINRIK